MKTLEKRMTALGLLLLMLLTLLPVSALADPGEEQGGIVLIPEEAEEENGEILPWDAASAEETGSGLCRLSFLCEPADTQLAVYDPRALDGNGEALEIQPDENGVWQLAQGEYLFSAWHKGYEPAERVSFFTGGLGEKTIDLTLRPLIPTLREPAGEEPSFDAALPLPTLTGDQALDTANIAQSQLGYTKNGGTVYGDWWNGVTSWGVDYTYADWCAMFACWCAYQAGAGLDVAYSKMGANANYLMEWQVQNASSDKTFTTAPREGDFIFFGRSDGVAGHVGIVTSYDAGAGRVEFVGGNQGSASCVSRGSVRWGEDSYWGYQVVLGYGRPNYSAPGKAPVAELDHAAGGDGKVSVSGWAFDPDVPGSPVWIHLYIGGPAGSGARRYDFEAKAYREDVEEKHPGAGFYHGFSKTFSVYERGQQTLYFYAYDLGPVPREHLFAQTEVDISNPMLLFYTVSYDANGGEGAPGPQMKSQDTPLILSSVLPTRAEERGVCTVTLDPRGGTVSEQSLEAEQRSNFSFRIWNTEKNGSGESYAPGASYTANAGATLYAQWDCSTETEPVELPVPTRAGFRFLGWAMDPEEQSGTGGSFTPDGDLTLYAIWAADPTGPAGDVNGDGKTDLLDLVRLRKHLAGLAVQLEDAAADLDGNGIIDSRDLLRLRMLLVGTA